MNNYNNKLPYVLCVSGHKNSGKTALIEALLPLLSARGVRTAVVKHHGHGFGDELPDKPGTDTYRFLANGACGTVIYDNDMFALVRKSQASTRELVSLFPDADLVIIEGAKEEPYPRIAMLRTGRPLTGETETLLCAVTDPDYHISGLPDGLPRFDFGDFVSVAAFILDLLENETFIFSD